MEVVAAQELQGLRLISQMAAAKALSASSIVAAAKDRSFAIAIFSILVFCTALPLHGGEHKRKIRTEDYGLGFSTEISAPENEVMDAVEAVVNDGIIQGSREFNKDKYVETRNRCPFIALVSGVEGTRKGLLQSAQQRARATWVQGQQRRRDFSRTLRCAGQRRGQDHPAN